MKKNKTKTHGESIDQDVLTAMDEMSDAEQNALILELASTRAWVAIQRYFRERAAVARNALYTLDPFKDQTQLARFQGVLIGLSDITELVNLLLKKKEEKETGEAEE